LSLNLLNLEDPVDDRQEDVGDQEDEEEDLDVPEHLVNLIEQELELTEHSQVVHGLGEDEEGKDEVLDSDDVEVLDVLFFALLLARHNYNGQLECHVHQEGQQVGHVVEGSTLLALASLEVSINKRVKLADQTDETNDDVEGINCNAILIWWHFCKAVNIEELCGKGDHEQHNKRESQVVEVFEGVFILVVDGVLDALVGEQLQLGLFDDMHHNWLLIGLNVLKNPLKNHNRLSQSLFARALCDFLVIHHNLTSWALIEDREDVGPVQVYEPILNFLDLRVLDVEEGWEKFVDVLFELVKTLSSKPMMRSTLS
jgi:hypothetical protein